MKLRQDMHQLPVAEVAFYVGVGLQIGVLTLPDVSEWVDEVLLEEPLPAPFFQGLYRSLRTSRAEVVAYLGQAFPAESVSVRPVLGWLQQSLSEGGWALGQVIHALYRLRLLVTTEQEVGWIYGLAADYERSADASAEALQEVYYDAEALLACYYDYTFANRAEWLYLDAVLPQRLAGLRP